MLCSQTLTLRNRTSMHATERITKLTDSIHKTNASIARFARIEEELMSIRNGLAGGSTKLRESAMI